MVERYLVYVAEYTVSSGDLGVFDATCPEEAIMMWVEQKGLNGVDDARAWRLEDLRDKPHGWTLWT